MCEDYNKNKKLGCDIERLGILLEIEWGCTKHMI
jgi:hypothetical protein